MKRINFELDEDTHTRLKMETARRKISVKDFVTSLLEEALKAGQQSPNSD